MLQHEERVLQEESELDTKIKALINFFDTKTFQSLHATDQYLLSEQYKHMCDYLAVLKLRVSRFKKSN